MKNEKRIHIDVDDEEFGRVASDATIIENLGHNLYLVSVDSIRANIVVTKKEMKSL